MPTSPHSSGTARLRATKPSAPSSTMRPSSRKVWSWPPARADASTTSTSRPALFRRAATARPASPAPTTTTRAWLTAKPHASCGIPRRHASVVRLGIARQAPPPLRSSALAERIKRATGADTVTLGARLQSLWGGYGELWRAELAHGAALTRVVVKHVRLPPGDGSRSHRRKLRSYEVEHAFYERYAARCS